MQYHDFFFQPDVMKKIKRPSTIKMKRLLMHFIECDVTDRTTLRELQDDARRVIYVEEDLKPGQRKSVAARTRAPKTAKPAKTSRKPSKTRAKRTTRARR